MKMKEVDEHSKMADLSTKFKLAPKIIILTRSIYHTVLMQTFYINYLFKAYSLKCARYSLNRKLIWFMYYVSKHAISDNVFSTSYT